MRFGATEEGRKEVLNSGDGHGMSVGCIIPVFSSSSSSSSDLVAMNRD